MSFSTAIIISQNPEKRLFGKIFSMEVRREYWRLMKFWVDGKALEREFGALFTSIKVPGFTQHEPREAEVEALWEGIGGFVGRRTEEAGGRTGGVEWPDVGWLHDRYFGRLDFSKCGK